MVDNKPRRSLVSLPGFDSYGLGQELFDLFREPGCDEHPNAGLSERDTVIDQADGARGPEQAICPQPEPGPMGQKARENGRVSPRRRTETRR